MSGISRGVNRFLRFAQLSRMPMAFLTVSVPITGALTVGQSLEIGRLAGLAAVGLCAHIFGFVMNDILDHEIDRTIPANRWHPLVTGDVSRRWAWVMVFAQIPLIFGIYRFLLHASDWAVVVLGASIVLSVVYNLWSKRGRVPPWIAELSLAASIGFLSLCGALLATPVPSQSIAFSATLAFVLLLLNSVPNHLKDIRTDSAFGAQSFVLSTGTRMVDGDTIQVSGTLWFYSLVLQAIISGCMLGLVYLFHPTRLVQILIVLLVVYAGLHLRMLLKTESFRQVRRSVPLLSGFYHYAALSLLVVTWMPATLQAFYALWVAALLLFPWWVAFRAWRHRYRLVNLP